MRLSLLLMPLSLSFSCLAISGHAIADERDGHPAEWHCVTDHFSEALVLNQERKPLYSMLSNGESDAISDSLMAFEHQLTRNVAPTLPLARFYWKAGVPVLCKEFVPIAETPAFADSFATPLPEGKVKFANPMKLAMKLEASLMRGGNARLAEAGREEIRKLDKADHYQCLVKHFLESIVYAAEVADDVDAVAREQSMPSTKMIYKISIQSQIASLMTVSKLDRQAEKVHRMGIPILCNDVPLILKDL